jgi:hypothetical protein
MTIKRLLALGAVVAVGVLFYTMTVGGAKQTCEVCVEFNGRHNCATARAKTPEAARTAAQQTACGPVASGMDQSIACGRQPPVSVQCPPR